MKTHVQNPWTRSPQLFVHMSVEEAQQLAKALRHAGFPAGQPYDPNQLDAYRQLLRVLDQALATERPQGIKGCMP